jgi:hypothetical protein
MSVYLMVHATPSGNYRIDCPACKATQAGNTKELASHLGRPFRLTCVCGHSFHVLVNVRSHRRKPCRLVGEYKLMQQGRPIEGPCTILDISQAGLRLEANHLPSVPTKGTIQLVVTLDDAARSSILLTGRILWVAADQTRGFMGIRLEDLDPHPKQMLGFYVL